MFDFNPLLRIAYRYFALVIGLEIVFCYMSKGFVTVHDEHRILFIPNLICGAIVCDQVWGPRLKNQMRRISAAIGFALLLALILQFTLLA